MKGVVVGLAVWSALALSGPPLSLASGVDGQRPGPQCMIDFYGGAVYTCYRPSAVSRVERGIRRFRPLDPSPIVATLTGLPLTQILLSQGTSDHRHPHGDGIYYIFSTSSAPLFSLLAPPERKYMVVSEGRARGAPITTTITSGPDVSYLNGGYLPRRTVGFGIESNVEPTLVRQVGAAMEQVDQTSNARQ